MDFRILGSLEVESDGQLLSIGSRQPRAVLTMLLLDANRVVSRDRLLEALWGSEPPDRAANALQVYVSQLRRALGPDVIVTQQPGYLIRVADGELDLARFERLVAESRSAEPAAAVRMLREALALWRGEPLADLPDVPSVQGERRRLEELRLSAFEARIEADLELGEHGSLVPELEALVREHPLRERLRGQLMVALYGSGRQAEALDVYRVGRRLLADELGLEPGEGLKRLERAILEQDPGLTPSAPLRPAHSARDVPIGTVTFLFTDVEGSTRLMEALGDDYGELLDRQSRTVRAALDEHGGLEVANQGDAFFFAFRRARDAVAAAVAAQRAILAVEWPRGEAVRIRIGIHTGEPGVAEGGYHGIDVVRAARISGAAHGGQILVSSATRDLAGDAVAEVRYVDLGEHGLESIEQPQRIFQALAPGLPAEFPPLRTEAGARVLPIGGLEDELAAAARAVVGAEERRLRVFRRSRIAALAGAVLIAGAVAAILLVVTGGSAAEVTVRANSVAVIDPDTNRLVDDVPVGIRPVAVASGLGGVWVVNADDGTVSKIDPRARKVVSTIGVGADVSEIAVGYGSVWVADGNDGTVHRIDPQRNAIQDILQFGKQSDLAPNPVFSIAIGAGGVWITRGNRLVRIDPQTDEATASFPIPAPIGIAVGNGSVWVATQDERLLRLDPQTGEQTGSLALSAGALSPLFGLGRLWMIVTLDNGAVWQVDPDSMTPTGTTTTSRLPIDLALARDAVWVAMITGTVLKLDVRTGDLVRTIRVGLEPEAIAVDEHGVWVVVQRPTS